MTAFSSATDSLQAHPRLVVLGLDGLPLSLAHRLVAGGTCPNLGRLVTHARAITAELPELSPVNWTSFMTAAGPEEHGVFGFTRIHAHTYEMGLTNFAHVQVPTLFDKLGQAGFSSRSINLPNTYPARPIKGMLISGFVAEELSRAVFPPMLAGMLRDKGYLLEADTAHAAQEPLHLLSELRRTVKSRRNALNMLWPDLAWNCFIFVLTETDRLFHFLFDAVEDALHPLHGPCMELLAEWDVLIGELLDRYEALPEPKRLLALADHGFTRLITEVDVNALLRDMGLLHTALPPEACDDLDATGITPATKAFALDPGRIYLHRRDRFARGSVDAAEAAGLTQRIRTALMDIRYQGQPVFKEIHTADALYNGPMRPYAPDLVCETHPGFDLKAKFNRRKAFGTFGRTGTHTVHDVFFFDSAAEAHGPVVRVRDVGKEILRWFGLAEPTAIGNLLIG
ncbi:alkaline phosphatase family protein [Desulfovibrio mangrovi]|uniref:alkaline phosphatase family protein n=1 Tax=Desulfovibrio mangrovi TaxID=2976983 RepID=UPI002247AB2B|nr:alkaline phosphatase family protein [Desulfovibrio mangrovi]UZP66798.1 alkaline phosphatase family protein [Desulfovibrio mangrovi]